MSVLHGGRKAVPSGIRNPYESGVAAQQSEGKHLSVWMSMYFMVKSRE